MSASFLPASKKLLLAIKDILKNRKIKYSEVANILDMSESGVKKLFNGNDISTNKLLRISNFLELDLAEIFQYAETHHPKENKITPELEKFFIQNIDYWLVFYNLVSENLPPRKFAKLFKLTEKELIKYLLKLDQLDLIKFYSLDRVALPSIESFEFADKGELIRLLRIIAFEEMQECTFKNPKNSTDDNYGVTGLKLTKPSAKSFIRELMDLDAKYNTKSNYERNFLNIQDMVDVSFSFWSY